MKLKNDLLLRAIRGEKVERAPVWLMRQAGRILPEYRAVRKKLSGFKELVETPELAAEVTVQPVDILNVDAAIIFSDILVIPEAMGLPYEMIEKRGPHFPDTIKTKKDIERLRIAEPENLSYTLDAIKITKARLAGRVPLIGFAGAPWTIFSYMIEGSGSKTFSKARAVLFQDPEMAHQLLEKITTSTINYLQGQIRAGVDVIQVFDSWAGILGKDTYEKFSLPYIRKICEAVGEVPVTVFAKGAYFSREELGRLPCETIGLDWHMDIKESRRLIGADKSLQGNLDPAVLYGPKEVIEEETVKMLKAFGPQRHVANLGHGVYPDTSVEAVKTFIKTVQNYRFDQI